LTCVIPNSEGGDSDNDSVSADGSGKDGSFEFTQSQQYVEGIGASQSAVDDFIDV
jgi:hypothetical protein